VTWSGFVHADAPWRLRDEQSAQRVLAQVSRLPLLARGWVLAFAHIRGGGEKGRRYRAAVSPSSLHDGGFTESNHAPLE
jgi:hypothetical protein